MSLVGTEILPPGSTSTDNSDQEADQQSSTQATPNAANAQTPQTAAPTLYLQDLVNGTKKAKVLTCEPWPPGSQTYSAYSRQMGCEAVTSDTTLGDLGYEGIRAHIKHMLFGGGPGAHVGLESDIISGTALSTAQKQFLQVMPGNLYTMLLQAQGSPPLVSEILGLMEPVAVNEYAVRLGLSLMAAEQNVYSGDMSNVIIANGYKTAVMRLSQSENVYMRNVANESQRILNANKLIEEYHKTLQAASHGGV